MDGKIEQINLTIKKIDINLMLSTFLLLILFSNCTSIKRDISGEYVAEKYCSLTLETNGDSLIGYHCFTAYNGNRIDWCDDKENTLFTIRNNNHTFTGFMYDCYANDTLKIKIISISQEQIQLIYLTPHSFLKDTLIFDRKMESF
jgi:hypothetical protein